MNAGHIVRREGERENASCRVLLKIHDPLENPSSLIVHPFNNGMYDIGKHTDSQQKIYQIESGQKGWNQKEDPLSKKKTFGLWP